LGDFTNIQSILKTQYPTTNIVNDEGKVVYANHPKSAPDHIFVQGVLEGGAVASLSFRSVPSAVDRTGFRWLISGTKGEIEVTAPELGWQLRSSKAALKVRVGKGEEIQTVDLSTDPTSTTVPFPGSNTAGLYDAFAKGDGSKYATFEDAVKTHHLLDRIVQSSKLS
jgi:predicted dehydrogenase